MSTCYLIITVIFAEKSRLRKLQSDTEGYFLPSGIINLRYHSPRHIGSQLISSKVEDSVWKLKVGTGIIIRKG